MISTTTTIPVAKGSLSSPSSLSSSETLISNVKAFVKDYMSQPHYDASHDYSHILRVLVLSQHILSVEQHANPSASYDPTIVIFAALMHDVDDHKYRPSASSLISGKEPGDLVKSTLLELGASPTQAGDVQAIVKAVSYSHEIHDPAQVGAVLLRHPELAIVQDADRIDALGAVGIGRTFTYTGAKGRKGRGMEETIDHFEEKLERLQGMMKTGEGRRIARERTERLAVFKGWWREETMGMVGSDAEHEE